MTVDTHTLLLMSAITFAVVTGIELLIWNQDRRERAILWVVAAGLLCNAAALLREALPDTAAIILANVTLLTGMSCIAAACRALGDRPPAWMRFCLPALCWAAACAVPAFMADRFLRVAISSVLCALPMGWAVTELWRDRGERLRTRVLLLGLCGLQGLATLVRGGVAACSIGAPAVSGVARTGDVLLATLWAFGFLLLVSLGVILFLKERAEVWLRLIADQDALTGLANRRRFAQALAAAVDQARRSRQSIAVLMIDADAFKLYNDRYGHLAGDRALQRIAEVLAVNAEAAKGLATRYGGEEFALLLPDTGEAEALRRAEALRDGVHALAIAHDDWHHGRVTISIGLASRVPTEALSAHDYLLAADQALYAAKRAGRHQVRVWKDHGAASPTGGAASRTEPPLPSSQGSVA